MGEMNVVEMSVHSDMKSDLGSTDADAMTEQREVRRLDNRRPERVLNTPYMS